jgi:hypothetical protein
MAIRRPLLQLRLLENALAVEILKKLIFAVLVVLFAAVFFLLHKVFESSSNAASSTVAEPTKLEQGEWAPLQLTDSLTGKKSIEYYVDMRTLDGPNGLTGVLRMRCNQRSIEAFVVFNRLFSFNKYPSLVMSQDGQIVREAFISARTNADGKTIFLNDDKETAAFFELLKDEAKDLRVRFSVSDGVSTTMKVPLRNASRSVDKVREQCSR